MINYSTKRHLFIGLGSVILLLIVYLTLSDITGLYLTDISFCSANTLEIERKQHEEDDLSYISTIKNLKIKLHRTEEIFENRKQELEADNEKTKGKLDDIIKQNEELLKLIDTSFLEVSTSTFKSSNPEYTKKIFTVETRPDKNGVREFSYVNNDLVILAGIHKDLGRGRTYFDFFKMLETLDHDKSITSISLQISDKDLFKQIDEFIIEKFNELKSKITKSEEVSKNVSNFYSKVTLIYAPFLEEKLKISEGVRHAHHLQKVRRKLLAQIRNFLVSNGIENEQYSLFLDGDIEEIHKDTVKVFIKTKSDIATMKIDLRRPDGSIQTSNYDTNSWAGNRAHPNEDEEKKMNANDPGLLYIPHRGDNGIDFTTILSDPEKYGISKEIDSRYELKSVGGAILFVKSEIYKQGIMFPPLYIIGTNWERKEGWDGVETEGLCYQANTIGYKCWGFPNMVSYHATS